MLFTLAALALGAATPVQQANRDAESRCIFEEARASGQGAGAYDKAKATCTARYHWTDGDAHRAIEVAACIIGMFKARDEARQAGVDPDDINSIMADVGERDLILLGNPDQNPEIRDAIIKKIALASAAKYGVSDKGKAARRVVFSMAQLLYHSGEFSDRYGQPN